MAAKCDIALFVLFSGAAVLVMGPSLSNSLAAASNAPAIASSDDHPDITVWKRSDEKIELVGTPPRFPSARSDHALDPTHIRPAWGMLAVVIGVFYYLWASSNEALLDGIVPVLN